MYDVVDPVEDVVVDVLDVLLVQGAGLAVVQKQRGG